MLDSERPSVMSNKFIVGNVQIAIRNMHRNVLLKGDPRIPGHKLRFSSFRSELNLCPLPAHTKTFPHGALTRHKAHHPVYSLTFQVTKYSPFYFLLLALRRFPFVCLHSRCPLRQNLFGWSLVSVLHSSLSWLAIVLSLVTVTGVWVTCQLKT